MKVLFNGWFIRKYSTSENTFTEIERYSPKISPLYCGQLLNHRSNFSEREIFSSSRFISDFADQISLFPGAVSRLNQLCLKAFIIFQYSLLVTSFSFRKLLLFSGSRILSFSIEAFCYVGGKLICKWKIRFVVSYEIFSDRYM